MRTALNLPLADLRIRANGNKEEVFDLIRKRYVCLTPEEWVRQHFIFFMKAELNMPLSHMAVEKGIRVNNLERRPDIVLYDSHGKAVLIVECKAPHIKLSQEVFDQVANYNMHLKVPFLVVTNGMNHYCCRIYADIGKYSFVEEIPSYDQF